MARQFGLIMSVNTELHDIEIRSKDYWFCYFVFVSLLTEDLKVGLLTETKAWRLHYGRACNVKYRTDMEENFAFIEDLGKRLSRPIKDLDDIRHSMAALKEIRENEIRIDMSIGPIEVRLNAKNDVSWISFKYLCVWCSS